MINKLFKKRKLEDSVLISDSKIIDSFISDPDFPRLISFPRTGSHWLRMMMELYFEKPSLVRSFYYHDATDFTCLHDHDYDLKLTGFNKVIYLYRNPVDTIYSLCKYYNEDLLDQDLIYARSIAYSDHLAKWVYEEKFTSEKVIISYENLRSTLEEEFKKITDFFASDFSKEKLQNVSALVTKQKLKEKTAHDKQVVNLNDAYGAERARFRKDHTNYIKDVMLDKNASIKPLLDQ